MTEATPNTIPREADLEVTAQKVYLKIVVMGDSSVGKTSLVQRFGKGAAVDFGQINSTIGVDFVKKEIVVDNRKVELQIWDTAGQERYHSLTASYFRGADGAVAVYDVTNRGTFEKLDYWLKMVERASSKPDVIIVGNKIDREGREVTRSEGLQYTKERGMLFMETSVLIGHGIVHIFEKLARRILLSDRPLKLEAGGKLYFTSERNSVHCCS